MDGKRSYASTPAASFPLVVALFGLTFVTGVIDAVSFLGLGHVFTANMTGNVVLLGFAMGGTVDLSVGRSLVALCAFASGSVVGGRLTNRRHRTPARPLLIAMYAEVLFLCLAAGATLLAGGEPSFAGPYLVIVLTAVAMGLRNAVVRKLAVPDLTTTVLTLTVTGLAADSGLAGGTSPRSGRRMLAVLSMCGGALVGTMLLRTLGMCVSLVVAALVVGAIAVYLHLRDRSMHAGSATPPFTEAKELIAGFSILQVKSLEEAIEWVRRGPNCSADDYEVEIRQVFEMEDFAPILSEEQIQHKVELRAELPNQTANK